MVKGFKDSKGKFRPTEKTNLSVKKNDIKIPCMTLSVSSGNTNELKRRKISLDNDNPESIKLHTDQDRNSYRPKIYSQNVRDKGNRLIMLTVNMEKKNYPETKDYVLHQPHIYNEYDNIQNTFAVADGIIEKLVDWRNDGNPLTWKWKSPLQLQNNVPTNIEFEEDGKSFLRNNPESKIFAHDNQNLSWESDGYKGQVAITLMSPEDFLRLASSKTLTEGRNDIRGEVHTKETIDKLTKLMEKGIPVDTPYLQINKNNNVYSHEGQHRALSAIEAGIKLMPVYVYSYDFKGDDIAKISKSPLEILKPDTRR